jgi:1,4-alpha-glucan branching enzyme
VDAVASMLYLDYGKKDGEWVANEDGGNINYDAIEFLKHLNSIVGQRVPGAMVIAEESTAFPLVSRPPEDGGLGFTFKWNMGWMHDVLEYLKVDPIGRQHVHNNVTFSFTYAFSENYVLPFSHDEVVHLKCSMINKMPGNMEDKFGNLRLAYGLMMAHPGKKLLFMGQDFAQLREWSEERSLDWYLLDNEPAHRALNNYTRALLEMYRSYPSLYENDCEPCGFEWINGADAQHNMLSFCRISSDKKKCLLFHFNFSPVAYPKHRIGALCKGTYRQVLNSDDAVFGGSGNYPAQTIKADPIPWDGKEYSVEFDVPPYSVTAFAFNWTQPVGKKAAAEKTAQKKTTVKVSPARKETGKAVKSRTSKKAEEEKKTAILKAIEGSGKSLDEILAFLQK